MKNISPNSVIKIKEIKENGKYLNIIYLDENGYHHSALAKVERENGMVNATLKDWNIFMEMLAETAIPESKIKDLENNIIKIIDIDIKEITKTMIENPDKASDLAIELNELQDSKLSIIEEKIKEEKLKAGKIAKNRKLFHVKEIKLYEKNGKTLKSIEIPSKFKMSRNLKTTTQSDPYVFFSFYNKSDNSPVKYSEIKTMDFSNTKMSAKISTLSTMESLIDSFKINDNVIEKMRLDGIEVGENGRNNSSLYRLIQVTSKNDEVGICKELKDFRDKYKKVSSSIKFEDDDINSLKTHYDKLLNLIIEKNELPKEYNLYLNLQSNQMQRRVLAEKMLEDVNSNIDSLVGDYRSEYSLKDSFFTNILGTIKIPKIKKGQEEKIEPRTVWYVESNIGSNIEPAKQSGEAFQGFISKQIENFIKRRVKT